MRSTRILSIAVALVYAIGRAAAADLNPVVRVLPYPFSHVVSFASDVDMQRAWHGKAIHRVFNEEIGLPISDSLWPQGSNSSSGLFLGPGALNRTASGVGTQPVYALLLREWHRGNIDQMHSWQDDNVYQLRNEINPPLALSAVRNSVTLPEAPASIASQISQNVRFYFSSLPPADLTFVLRDREGKTISLAAGTIAQDTNAPGPGGVPNWYAEVIIPAVTSNPLVLAVNPMLIDRVDLISPACASSCGAKLTSVDRDHFSRQTVLSESRWLERWNIRPALFTSHGGDTIAQDFGGVGDFLEFPRTPGTLFADKAVVARHEALAGRQGSYAYYADLLKDLSVMGVWFYYASDTRYMFGPLASGGIQDKLPKLPTKHDGFYEVLRSTLFLDVSSKEKFSDSLKSIAPKLSEENRESLYCGPACNSNQGDALAMLLSQSIYMINNGERAIHFWYSHFGSGGSKFKPSLEQPVTPSVLKGMRRLDNYVYDFDRSVSESRRVWSPPANTWLRYQILQAGIADHVKLGKGSSLTITPWEDPVTHVMVPDSLAGSRDLHGLTLYVDNPGTASVLIGNRAADAFTRNPPDTSGRPSITVVDDNTPTSVIGRIALRDRGKVRVKTGNFLDVSPTKDYISLEAGSNGRAMVVFKPWALDLWNTSHVYLALRKRLPGVGDSPGPTSSITIEMAMEDGGVISIVERGNPAPADKTSSSWRMPQVGTKDGWRSNTFDVAQLDWPQVSLDENHWRRPPLPLGRVREVRITLSGASAGEVLDIRSLRALRPSGNGEAPGGVKLVAGRITTDGSAPLALLPVEAASESGEIQTTATDRDGYYFFYGRKRGERMLIRALVEASYCYPMQGRQIEVLKNEAEIDIQTNLCGLKH